MALTVKTAPTGTPITLAEAKEHLNVDSGDDDVYIATLIQVATDQFETDTSRALVDRTYFLDLEKYPAGDTIELQMPPLESVSSLKQFSTGGVTSTVSASTYGVDTSSEPGRMVLEASKSWPSDTLRSYNGVRVEYVAGYGTASSVPELAKNGIKILIGSMYAERERAVTGTIRTSIPTYDNIVWAMKVVNFP